jgi:hypothetical protein
MFKPGMELPHEPAPGARPSSATRREFLRDCLRYPVAAGLVALGGVLALRQADPSRPVPCLKQRVCRGCQLFDDCDLPQARETKNQPQ